jgi:hypothetical protein
MGLVSVITEILPRILSSPVGLVLLMWAALAAYLTWRGWRPMLLFFGLSFVAIIIGAIWLVNYSTDPAVDGDGTTLFGSAVFILVTGAYAAFVFLSCAAVRAVAEWLVMQRARKAGTII